MLRASSPRVTACLVAMFSVAAARRGESRPGASAAAQGGTAADRRRPPAAAPSIDERVSGMQKIDGYFPLYWDERTGSLFLEIPKFDTEFLFTTGLAAGLGSNDIGLDRGGRRGGRVVLFQRVGPRVLLVQPNQSFRSSSPNPLERKSVEDSFAKSVLWGFTVAAESERPRARRRDRLPAARRHRRRQRAAARAPTASTARAARSTCRAPKDFRRTAKSR